MLQEQIAHLEKDIQSLVQSTEKEVEERSQNAREQLVAEHDRKVGTGRRGGQETMGRGTRGREVRERP